MKRKISFRIRMAIGFVISLCALFSSSQSFGQTLAGSFSSKFTRYSQGQPFVGTTALSWADTVWIGERANAQIILWSPNSVDQIVTFSASNLVSGTNTIASSNISLRPIGNVVGDPQARSCAGYSTHPDEIQIADALTTSSFGTVSTSDPLKVWMTIDVPATTQPGIYSGTLQFVGGSNVTITFTINLTVVNKILPPPSQWKFHLDLWQYPNQLLVANGVDGPGGVVPWSPTHLSLLQPYYTTLANMGQKAITAHIKDGALGGPSMIQWKKNADGTWSYDYTGFDYYVSTLTQWGISQQINCFSVVGWNSTEIPYFDVATGTSMTLNAPINSVVYNTSWNNFLTAFKIHLDEKGWFSKTVLFMDEIAETDMISVVNLIHTNNPSWRIGLAHAKQVSASILSQISDVSGALSLSGSGKTNPTTTFYTSCVEKIPNNYLTPENNPAELTWMAWYACQGNLDGYLRWAYDYWITSNSLDMRNRANTAGDFAFVYFGSNGVNFWSSIRLEMLREGIQDFEKIRILRSQLSSSADPYDVQSLKALNFKVAQFTMYSGTGAAQLVNQGQSLIKLISAGAVPNEDTYPPKKSINSYCKAYGGSTNSYYLTSVSANGATGLSISYTSTSMPLLGYYSSTVSSDIGYQSNTGKAVQQYTGANITLAITTSSKCANTTAWIDWNENGIFTDAGEVYKISGSSSLCQKPLAFSTTILVPTTATPGDKKIRIQIINDAVGTPNPCGTTDQSATYDFIVRVLDKYATPFTSYNTSYWTSSLSTWGNCNGNINYSLGSVPYLGYNYFTKYQVKVNRGNSFLVNLTNSDNSRYAVTKVWIDWNNDKSFGTNEVVFIGGDTISGKSGQNPLAYTFNVSVPSTATAALTRMRVVVRDSWQAKVIDPTSTGMASGATDFNISIYAGTLSACTPSFTSPIQGTQLAGTSSLFTWTLNGTVITAQTLTVSSQAYPDSAVKIHFKKVLPTTSRSYQVTNLPSDGRALVVSLSFTVGGSLRTIKTTVKAYDRYCLVGGGNFDSYYVTGLVSKGGQNNLSYSNNSYPSNGYIHSFSSYLAAPVGSYITINLTNSVASYAALTSVWIDWNNNQSFNDPGEQVFTSGTPYQAVSPVNLSFSFFIPATVSNGTKRMRIQLRDAWLGNPVSCGINNDTGTSDFDILVITGIPNGKITSTEKTLSEQPIVVFPNPGDDGIFNLNLPSTLTSPIQASIYSSAGTIIRNMVITPNETSYQVDLRSEVRGVYILVIEMQSGVQTFKLVR